ncbi:hypothetical protein EGW08_018185 [Elysia chlorotica]|uniref:Fibronectin type-III domain-containing protein n=1 Tax=Elysia chlorotica TaxID=188477 RepID=A0A3S0ZG47_ELYCH|nr:hypothetical protein EGW08_018185 [Elysia chlorotica]
MGGEAHRHCWRAVYVGLALAVLTLPPACDAQVWCTYLLNAFDSSNCKCFRAEGTIDVVLDCSNLGLVSVPPRNPAAVIPQEVIIHEFILANNSITRLEDTSFQGLRVRALDLSGNSIASVSDSAFSPLETDLRELNMEGNFNQPPKSALDFLTNLEVLTLGDYSVNVLGDADLYFLSFKSLKHLTLREWNIQVIETDALRGPNALQSLTLIREKDMFSLPVTLFREDDLKSLKVLKISVTSIGELGDFAFTDTKLVNLEELDLSENHINKIKATSLEGLGSSLKKLSLASNYLRSDSEMTGLRNLPQLEELDLSGNEDINVVPDLSGLNPAEQINFKLFLGNNKINALSSNAFRGIAQRLHTLDLSQNSITAMDKESFNGVTNLRVLRLSQQKVLTSGKLALPASLSQSANTLTHLYLDGQGLDEAALLDVLPQMTQLEILDLSRTGLSTIPDLKKMVSLQELYLNGNLINFLDQHHLEGPRHSLKKLVLSQNPLQLLPSCTFAHYTSFPIILDLESVQLVCDCRLAWLYKSANDGDIVLTHPPLCSNFKDESLLSKSLNDICSNSTYQDPPCDNPYTTATPTTVPGPPTLELLLVQVTSDSLTLSWSLSSDVGTIKGFDVKVTNNYGDSEYVRTNLLPRIFQVTAKPLLPDTQHQVCVIASFTNINSTTKCTFVRTKKSDGTSGQTGDSDSNDTGIIIGAVVGAILLLVVLAAIFYLVVLRRRPKKDSGPTNAPIQPRNFTKSELPAMTEDSRTFTRPKRPVDHHDGMQVVAISDGQVDERHASNGSARVGRAMLHSGGSYKVMSAGASSMGGTSASGSMSGSQSLYENDHGLLPKTPAYHDRGNRGPRQPGYYNAAFEPDKYDEIDMQREVSL